MAGHISIVFGWTCTEVSVLGIQVYRRSLNETRPSARQRDCLQVMGSNEEICICFLLLILGEGNLTDRY